MGCPLSRRLSLYIGVGALLALPACQAAYPDTKLQPTPPTVQTAVGPIPGPEDNPPRPQNPFKDNRDARGEGRQLFVRFNCSGCHGGRAGGGMGPSLRDVDWLYGSEEAQIFSAIAEGRAHGMPSWRTKLTQDQIWKLVTYIKSLRTPNEVDPPS
jgi:cytochrome c oxidase cbb3-type subunit 3